MVSCFTDQAVKWDLENLAHVSALEVTNQLVKEIRTIAKVNTSGTLHARLTAPLPAGLVLLCFLHSLLYLTSAFSMGIDCCLAMCIGACRIWGKPTEMPIVPSLG